MSKKLEICIDTLQSAESAVKGGADRLEVCSSLALGGLTPSIGLVKAIKQYFPNISQYCMIRARGGNFCYDPSDIEVMKQDLIELKQAGASGFVFGFLNNDLLLDVDTCKTFIELADGLPCTLHRAFDVSTDWKKCLNQAIELGFSCILTSGQESNAVLGVARLHEMIIHAGSRIEIMVVSSKNLRSLIETLGASWYHGSASKSVKEANNKIAMGTADNNDLKYTCSLETSEMKKILLEY